MTRPRVGVAIDVGQQHEDEHGAGGNEDPGNERIEAREQLLQPGEVPRCLRRLGREVRVREAAQRRAERDGEAEHDRRGAERDDDVTHEQMRPGEHGVVDRSRRFGDRLTVDDAEQADAPAVQLRRGLRHGLGGRRGRRALGRLFGERADARALHGEAVLAHAPDVHGQHQDQEHREHGDVQRVEAQQRVLADLGATDQQVLQLAADQRDVVHEIRADRDRPVRQLVPGQQVAGEREREREQQQHHADHPVELARLLVGAGVEHAHEMQRDDEHHEVRRPAVHVPDQLPEAHAGLQVLHVAVRRADRRRVHEHQVDAGDEQDAEEHRRDEAEPERVAHAQHALRDLDRVHVQEDVAERLERATAWRVELRVTEHRTPRVAALDPRGDAVVDRRAAGLELVEVDVSHA